MSILRPDAALSLQVMTRALTDIRWIIRVRLPALTMNEELGMKNSEMGKFFAIGVSRGGLSEASPRRDRVAETSGLAHSSTRLIPNEVRDPQWSTTTLKDTLLRREETGPPQREDESPKGGTWRQLRAPWVPRGSLAHTRDDHDLRGMIVHRRVRRSLAREELSYR